MLEACMLVFVCESVLVLIAAITYVCVCVCVCVWFRGLYLLDTASCIPPTIDVKYTRSSLFVGGALVNLHRLPGSLKGGLRH